MFEKSKNSREYICSLTETNNKRKYYFLIIAFVATLSITIPVIASFLEISFRKRRSKSDVNAYRVSQTINLKLDLKDTPKLFFNGESTAKNAQILEKVYAQSDGIYTDNEIAISPKVINTATGNVETVDFEINKDKELLYSIDVINKGKILEPGTHKITVDILQNERSQTLELDFSWGVLAINTNKPIYKINDTAKISIAVLDDKGDMVCNADVELTIFRPLNKPIILSTKDKTINVTESCDKKEFVLQADYESELKLDQIGTYDMVLKASTANGTKVISDSFEVKKSLSYDIERITATRIYPVIKYPVLLKVTANQDYNGPIYEEIPSIFKIENVSKETVEKMYGTTLSGEFNSEFILDIQNDIKTLTWDVSMKKGETYYFSYIYDSPDKSPNIYTIGPLKTNDYSGERNWKIAVDYAYALPHVEVFTDTDDTGANATINVFEDVNNTTISHAAMIAAGFDDTEDILLVMDVNFDGNSSSALYSVRAATTGGTAIPDTTETREPRTADDRNIIVRVVKKTTKASGEGLVIQKAYHTSGQTIPRVQKARMVILGLGDLVNGIEYMYDENTTDTGIPANGNIDDFATITTPEDSQLWKGDILVMDSWKVEADNGIGSDRIMHDLEQDDTTAVNETSSESEDSSEIMGDGTIYVFTHSDTNSHTYKVRLENSDSSTTSYDHVFSSVIAFPANLFEDFEYFNNDSEYDLTNTSFQEIGGITPFIPQNTGDFWILGSAIGTGACSTNGDDTRIRIQLNGSTVPSGFDESTEGAFFEDTCDQYPLNRSNIENLSTSSQDIDMDGASDSSTVDFYYRTLVALSFGLKTANFSGIVYTDDDEVSTLNSYDVCIVVDKGANPKDCDTTDGSGAFNIDDVFAATGSEQLTFFVDHATVHGNLVTIGDGTDISGLELYQNHIKVEAESGDTITIANMDGYDNDDNATDLLFDAENSSPDTLSVEYGNELYVASGETFAPGGNVDAHDIEIDGTWTSAASETINLDGTYKLDSGGTLNPSTSTITFDGTGGTEDLITAGTGDLYNLTLNDSGGSLTIEVEDALVVQNDITITGGTLDVKSGENNQITVGRHWDNDDRFEAQTGTVLFNEGSGTATIDAEGTASDNGDAFYDITFNDSGGSATYQLSADMYVDNDLTITGGTLSSNGNDIYLGGNWTNDDIFSEGTDTLYLSKGKSISLDTNCSDADTCTNQNFYNLHINKGTGGEIVTLSSSELRVTNTLTIESGEFVQTTDNVRLEGTTGTALQLYDFGRYTNISTGNLTLGGNVINNYGSITLNSNGDACGDTNTINLTSTAAVSRTWSGEGAFRLTDVNIDWMASTPTIKAINSIQGANMSANWIFVPCEEFYFEGLNLDGINTD